MPSTRYSVIEEDDGGDIERNHHFHVVELATGKRVLTFIGRSYHGFFEHEGDEWGARHVELGSDGCHVVVHDYDGTVQRVPIPGA